MRTFSGAEEFKKLSDAVINSYSQAFPVEKNGHKLELAKIWLDDKMADPQDYTDQKKVKLAGGTWGVPVMASLVLKDNTGKVVDRIEKIRVATIPRITPRRSYIVGGNEYQVANQMIRKPGTYVVRSQKGDTFKGMVALGGEATKNFDVQFDPQTNKYKVEMGQASIPLYPLLKSLGATDQELIKAWGEPVFKANKQETDRHYTSLASKLARANVSDRQSAIEAINNFAKTTKVDPSITEITLGKKYENLSKGMLLDTATKLLHTYSGKTEPDDPENLLFKEIRSVEDMIHDKLTSKKEQEGLKRMLARHLGKKTSIKHMIDFRKLTSPVESFFISDNRTGTPEQYNPVHMLAEASKLTIHGTGGIESEHAVTANLREVHPSHIGFIDPVFTPESERTGTTLHLAAGVHKNGREINAMVYNPKTARSERITPKDMYYKVVAFPDEMANGKFRNPQEVRVQFKGKVMTVPASKVDYVLPSPVGLFSHSSNLVPFLKNNQGARAAMASKMLGQALPLVEREAPLVQTAVGNTTFHKAIGQEFSVFAPKSGTVKAVTADYIQIDDKKIPLYNNFPLNQKTHIHHEPHVKVGDRVKEGQFIADSNFTKGGTLALGKNLTVAYLPYPGLTFEDGIVVTESGAKKLAAEETTPYSFGLEEGRKVVDLKKWIAYYGAKLGKQAYEKLDTDGLIKKGTTVKPGDVLIAGLTHSINSPENMTLRKINKSLTIPWSDSSVTYKGEFPGVVTDVVKRADGVRVYVKTVSPARESDKLSGVHGNKGVISRVIPDHEAPRTKDGKVPDVFLNPHGIIGRINLGQMYESAAAKIAQKTGKPYVVANFDHDETNKKILQDLKKHGVSDTEELFDPKTGKSLGKVNVGNPYILRLAKTGKSGFSARMPGAGYDQNLQPIKGGEEGSKSLDTLTFYSMLSHGAKKNLLDAHYKSEKNDEFWHAIETGKSVPAPKPSFAFEKFLNLIRGSGINVEKKGTDFVLAPMTDKDVLKISRGKVHEPEFLYGKDLKEKKGGFFDTVLTGGLNGKNYTHIELPERLPNPVFENAIKSVTGLKKDQYEGLVAGKLHLATDGTISEKKTPGSRTGGEAVSHALSKIDVDAEIAKLSRDIKKMKEPEDIDRTNRRLRYLLGLKELNLSPAEAYTRKHVPVVPPIYRPVQEVQGRGLSVAPVNYLYQTVGLLSKAHDYPVMKLLDDSEKTELRSATYKATRALAGLEDVTPRGKDQPIQGFISQITGDSPKRGFFLNKLISKKQDLTGRGVITNGPDLHVDELGVPEKMAWNIFRPFIIREFVLSGFKPEAARKEVDDQTPRAHQMLESVMKKRTVLMNRAPSLHKFSIMAFKPKLTDGLAIQVPPLVFKGMNADVDGDAVTLHVPVSEEAVRESSKMFPSNNLWKPGTGELMLVPSQEAAIGVYFMSQTPEGRKEINKHLPAKFHVSESLDAKKFKALFNQIAKEMPQQFPNIVHSLKQLGDQHSYQMGLTASLKDLVVDTKTRDTVFRKADRLAADIKRKTKPGAAQDNQIASVYEAAAKEAYDKSVKPQLKKNDSMFYHMVASGARGKDSQLMQLVSAPGIMLDAKDRKVPVPIKKSYAEGIATSDYFISSYGVRKGMMDRSLQTAKPGELNKDILASTVDNIITEEDCGVHKGVALPTSSSDVYDRYLAVDQHGFRRNTPVTPQLISEFKKKHVDSIIVRTPLKCLAKKGTCAHCFGKDEHGHLPPIGENIGAKMGQAMSEPVTQFVMRTFHSGGVATGAPTAKGFERVKQLLSMPKYVAGEAPLAKASGKVTKIEKSAAGGFNIHVGKDVYTSRPGLTPKVKVGDSILAGDPLTDGVVKPQLLAKYKGMGEAQNYIVDELQKVYQAQDVGMHRKVFETVVRSVANNTQVVSAPKHTNFLPGDVIPYTTAVHYNETRKGTVPVDQAAGYHLKEAVGKLPVLHEITDKDVAYLKSAGLKQVEVLKDPIVHAPALKGIQQLPIMRKDWMSQLGYRDIKKSLTEGAAQIWKSNIEGAHPVPAFAYGASFGKKKEHY